MKVSRISSQKIVHWLLYVALTVSIVFLFYFIKEVFKEKSKPEFRISCIE